MKLPDKELAKIVKGYARLDYNASETAREIGVHRATVRKAVERWLSGDLKVKCLPRPEDGKDPREKAVKEVGRIGKPPIIPVEPAEVRRLKNDLKRVREERDELLATQEFNKKLETYFKFIKEARVEIPVWTTKAPGPGEKKQAIATTLLSDLHLDEVVLPAQVNYVNEYNREIAGRRLENYFRNVIELSNDYIHGLKYEGLAIGMAGDTFSGNIHEELRVTNEATIFESMLYWAAPFCAGLKMLKEAFGRVFIVSVPGNHGRNSFKPIAKNRAQDNFDWFFAHLLRKLLDKEKGISWLIPEASDITFQLFNTRYLLTHGDQFRGGSGISGLLAPLMIGDARKRKRETAVRRHYDYMAIGHWHQLSFFKGVIVNSSLKGYDEFAMLNNFDFEPPCQAWWITDPVYGKTITAPVHVQDKSERYTGREPYKFNGMGFQAA